MAWRDELQPASFKGVSFKVNTSDLQSGRRVVEHEYPQRDVPFGEDLGRQARSFTLEAFVLGADYLAQKNALLDACESAGPGELVHPYYGSRQVLCTSVRIREAINEGGVARFSLTFNEAGQPQFPTATIDLPAAVEVQADAVLNVMETSFAEQFSVLQQPQFVLDQAVTFMDASITQMQTLADSILNPIADVQQSLNDFKSAIDNLMATPGRMSNRFKQTLGALSGSLARSPESIDALQGLATQFIANDTAPVITPSRKQAQNNQRALNQLVQGMALVETLRLSSGVAFDSFDDAISVRVQLLERVDTLELEAADDVFLTLQALRSVFSQAVPSPDQSLPRIVEYVPIQTLPALVIAYDVYGDATREPDIINRNKNKIAHPGFVSAEQSLEILVGS